MNLYMIHKSHLFKFHLEISLRLLKFAKIVQLICILHPYSLNVTNILDLLFYSVNLTLYWNIVMIDQAERRHKMEK